MTDQEFETYFDAAWQEAWNDPEEDHDMMTPSSIALQVHSNLFEANYHELCTRGHSTEEEITEVMAMKQAILAYHVLQAQHDCEMAMSLARHTDSAELSPEEKVTLSQTFGATLKFLSPLDDVASLARQVLIGLGLPSSIKEFEDYDANRCRIKLTLTSCVLASGEVCRKMEEALRIACMEN